MIKLEVSERELSAATDALIRDQLRSMRIAVNEETRGLEQDLEKITRMAVPGRLWRAWKSETFPSGGGIARSPGGEVYVNGGDRSQGAMRFFTETGRIKSRTDFWLAIPTKAAGSRGRGRKLTPGEWERATGQKLEFIYRPGKPGLLISKGTTNRRSGVYRQITARRTKADERRGFVRGEQWVIIFILVPFVNFKPGFSVEALHRRREASLAGRIARSEGTSLQ